METFILSNYCIVCIGRPPLRNLIALHCIDVDVDGWMTVYDDDACVGACVDVDRGSDERRRR